MSLVRWDPFRELEDMSDRLNRMFGRPVARPESGKEAITVADWIPAVDISETDAEYLIKAELPEVKKEDVKVTVQHGVLTIHGERKHEKEEKGERYTAWSVPTEASRAVSRCPMRWTKPTSERSIRTECCTSTCRNRKRPSRRLST